MSRSIRLAVGLSIGGLVAYGCATSVEPTDDDEGDGGAGGVGGAGPGSTSASSAASSTSTASASSTSSSASASSTASTGGPICGNGICDGGETCQSCPGDCGSCCGNGQCDASESCQICPSDCGPCDCGDGICAPNECFNCPIDCTGQCCGDGFCDFFEDCQSCLADCGPGCCPTANPGDPTGPSIFLFANYDGGQFTVSVDANVPNIVLGFISYEAMSITITGPYVANVTAVHYAGYNDVPGTTINGVAPALITIEQFPPATLADPSGNATIDCQYGGGCANQGGCNTAAQIKDYFVIKHAGTIASHACQYGVYAGTLSTSVVTTCN